MLYVCCMFGMNSASVLGCFVAFGFGAHIARSKRREREKVCTARPRLPFSTPSCITSPTVDASTTPFALPSSKRPKEPDGRSAWPPRQRQRALPGGAPRLAPLHRDGGAPRRPLGGERPVESCARGIVVECPPGVVAAALTDDICARPRAAALGALSRQPDARRGRLHPRGGGTNRSRRARGPRGAERGGASSRGQGLGGRPTASEATV
jgi:hypothetical protein